jgi:hypothetical protein
MGPGASRPSGEKTRGPIIRGLALAALLAGAVPQAIAAAPAPAGNRPGAAPRSEPTRYLPDRFAGRAGRYYRLMWGIDGLSVQLAESGELVRFSWRVLDADKAQTLNEKAVAPSLIDPQRGVSLVVPSVDNVGMLRQAQPPVNGKRYWMVFSNSGRPVKRGDRVDVVIGQFRAEGLVVD